MRDIQSVGMEIFGGKPEKIYVFLGTDYGIKQRYIAKLKECYKGVFTELSCVDTLLNLFSTRRLIPPVPQLYVIRYDNDFTSGISDDMTKKLVDCKIIGTAVLVYEDNKQENKLSKYLGDYCVRFDPVGTHLIHKYLSNDYADIPTHVLECICKNLSDYARCDMICQQLSKLPDYEVSGLSENDITDTFYISHDFIQDSLKLAVQNRDTSYLIRYIESGADITNLPYVIISAMLDIEKQISSKYYKKNLRWTFQDVYNMTELAYYFLCKSRSSYLNIKDAYTILVILLRYNPIPKVEDII